MRRRTRFALVVLGVLAALALLAPWMSAYSPEYLDWQHLASPPQLEGAHWLGTDRLGRDLFARSMQAMRVSMLIGVLAALVSVCIGVAWGATAGYLGGQIDAAMMRFVDIVYALPYVFIVIILASLFDRGSIAALFIAIGAVGWLTMARIVRGQTLSLRRREFIDAAIETGADAILVSSIYGHGEIDCMGFRDRCVERGLAEILLYVGGNLIVGKRDFSAIEVLFKGMGFDRVFRPSVDLSMVAELLKGDITHRRLQGRADEVSELRKAG